MKYKVILADDEEEVLQSIQRKLEWGKYGFEVVETFLNGSDVMEFLETQEADLVITDIRMPFMDGIEVAKRISERYPQIKVIILSGYGDFNYAKEAMSYHVSDYILKPVNAKEMEEVLRRAREELDREREEKKSIHFLKSQYMKNLPIIRESLLNQLISGEVQEEEISERLSNCGIHIGNAACWTAVLFQMDKVEQQTGNEKIDKRYVSIYIRNLIQERFGAEYHYQIFGSGLGECAILGLEEPAQIEKILLRLNGIAREARRSMGICLGIGVGKIKKDFLEIKASFREAREAVLYRQMAKYGEVIYIEDIKVPERDYVLFDEKSREVFFSALKFGGSQEIRQILGKISAELKNANITGNGWRSWSLSFMNALLLFDQQHPDVAEAVFGGRLDCMEILSRYEDMDSFFEWLEKESLMIGAYFEKERMNKNKSIIEVAQEYMQKKFAEPEISLEAVAAEIGLTTTYFSSLFKKETGETFVEYLTRLRLEEAMRMLEETDEKIYSVAEKTGYPDAGYFSYIFKKKYGISPIQYRRQRK